MRSTLKWRNILCSLFLFLLLREKHALKFNLFLNKHCGSLVTGFANSVLLNGRRYSSFVLWCTIQATQTSDFMLLVIKMLSQSWFRGNHEWSEREHPNSHRVTVRIPQPKNHQRSNGLIGEYRTGKFSLLILCFHYSVHYWNGNQVQWVRNLLE